MRQAEAAGAGEQVCGKSFGVLLGSEVNVSPRCALAAKAASSLLGCMNRDTAHRLRGEIVPLYVSLIRPRYPMQFGGPSTAKTWSNMEGAWRGPPWW